MRPIGQQMRAMLEASDLIGRPATSRELQAMADVALIDTNCTKICSRAIGHGLMTGDNNRPRLFQVVPGWRSKLDKPLHSAETAAPAVARRRVCSVWDLANA